MDNYFTRLVNVLIADIWRIENKNLAIEDNIDLDFKGLEDGLGQVIRPNGEAFERRIKVQANVQLIILDIEDFGIEDEQETVVNSIAGIIVIRRLWRIKVGHKIRIQDGC